MPLPLRIIKWILRFTVLYFGTYASYFTFEASNYRLNGISVEGRVVDFEILAHTYKNQRGNKVIQTTRKPIISFIPRESSAEVRVSISDTTWMPNNTAIGDKWPILYHPMSPRRARVETFMGVWGLALTFWGIVFLAALPEVLVRLSTRTSASRQAL